MPEKVLKIIGINPGTRYLGIAIFHGPSLMDWGIKVIKGIWSKEKIKKIKEIISCLIERYDLNTLAIKKLHPARSSTNLKVLTTEIKNFCRRKGLKIFSYSIKEVESYFSPDQKINKRQLAELTAIEYPALYHELKKEKRNKNPYFVRLFEAVALGSVCYYQNG